MMTRWTKKQQKANRAKWMKALRSGRYAQTKQKLTDGKGFCCLGVACEVSKLGEWVDGPNGEWVYRIDARDSDDSVLPNAVRRWLGLRTSSGTYDNSTGWGHKDLTEDNDDGKRFPTIAKIIENEPEGLTE